jgi:hypothetical protein
MKLILEENSSLPEKITLETKELMNKILHKDPKVRLGINELLQEPKVIESIQALF